MRKYTLMVMALIAITLYSCHKPEKQQEESPETNEIVQKLGAYEQFTLTADLSSLSDDQKQMIKYLIEAADLMDQIFWQQAYGNKAEFMASLPDDSYRAYAEINYGPWDRLDDNKPFVEGVNEKPKGARFYPTDMSKEEFDQLQLANKASLYTMIKRDQEGNLYAEWYHEAFPEHTENAAKLLDKAAELAEDDGFKKYLELRAKALRTDDYLESDMAWMEMKSNPIDVVIGPIENYEDKLFNYKAAHEAYVLIKDMEWSDRLAKYASYLPELQKGLPVPEEYKEEKPGANADLNAYDVVYYAGDCNAGSKTIAINLPNDERVQLEKGSRRLQLKNAMRAKFDKILVPISEVLISEEQRKHITFDAFFANTMFHEVAHGLGIKETINGKGAVRKAMKENSSAIEEGKADILGLYMITELHKKGELEGDLKDYYTTFLAGIFRSVRFGAASAHGKANMVRFNFFKDMEAFSFDEASGTYKVNYDKMVEATDDLSTKILTLQGDGDYEGASKLLSEKGVITDDLQKNLNYLTEKKIPVDIVFNQGIEVLGI